MMNIETVRQQEQQRLDALKTPQERNRTGQFSTPISLAREITQYMKELRGSSTEPIRFLEPSIGTGAFYSAVFQTFSATELATAVGIEIDPQIVLASRRLWVDTNVQIIEGDFTQLTPINEYNLVLANPPYVRHQHIETAQKRALQARVKIETG